jgi:pimeloyl-ACP methyl ester carboxylesterase
MGLALAWLESAYIRTALRDSAMARRLRQIVIENSRFWMDLIRLNDPEREAEPPAAGRLAEIHAPVLLLVGEEDTPFIQDVARAIAERAPNVRRIDLPGVGHMVNLEAPDRFREAVLEFLAAPAAGR